ncbi:MAG TPA: recombinase family protein, partial [bacterium]|nr:recombinase family protein [bacterium]
TRRGLEGAVLRGLSAGGRAFGYRSEPVKDDTGRVIGHRRVIDPAEAEVVRYIYQLYASGLIPRAIAQRLNQERVPAPRTARGRRTGSWMPSTIHGSSKKGFGILNNPIYRGEVVWNRSAKVRDPETGRRIMRVRPRSEWTVAHAPDLRIVPQDLWERVQARREQRAWTQELATHGSRPRHLLSGLMLCAECGGRFVIKHHHRGVRHYGCAVHADRGSAVCQNNRVARQEVIVQKILAHIFGGLFAPHRVAYLERAVNAALSRALQHSADTVAQREAALRQARQELENIAAAIRAGIITPTTKTMLEDAERRVTALEHAMTETRRRPAAVVSVRSAVERYLRDLQTTLGTNLDEARRLLSMAVDKIVIRREGKHLIAQVVRNFAGMFALEPDLCASVGAGRGI